MADKESSKETVFSQERVDIFKKYIIFIYEGYYNLGLRNPLSLFILMINNFSKLKIFDSFIKLYGENECCKDIDIKLISFEQPPFCGCNKYDSPFETCVGYIACSTDICLTIGLVENEMYALIAHEIGHIFYKTSLMPSTVSILEKEKKADSMAIQFGLKNELSSALQKLIDSGKYEDVKEDLRQRVITLSKS